MPDHMHRRKKKHFRLGPISFQEKAWVCHVDLAGHIRVLVPIHALPSERQPRPPWAHVGYLQVPRAITHPSGNALSSAKAVLRRIGA
eukprot:6729298-Pyramimonas_sp.AAC.1